MLAQGIFNGLMSAGIYVLIAIGLTLVLGILGIVQLAHGEVYMLGAYGTYFLCTMTGFHFVIALLVSMVVTGLLGIVLEKIFFRPFRDDPERAVIVAIGLILFLQQVVFLSVGGVAKSIPNPFSGIIRIGGIVMPVERILIVAAAVVLVLALLFFISKTKIGQAMVAVSQNRESAALYGINSDRISALAMFLGCCLAAAAGGLVGSITGVSPGMGGIALIKGIAVLILGGLGSITGAVIGGFLIGMLDGIIPIYFSTQVAGVAGFGIIIVILIIRPRGLMGHE